MTAPMIFLPLIIIHLNAKRLLQQATCDTIRCGSGGPCYDNPFTGSSICCPGDSICSNRDYLSTDPVVCSDGNVYPNQCYAYCSGQDATQCAPHCTGITGCISPITGECSSPVPCAPRPDGYCPTDPSSQWYTTCTAYPHARCRFTGCGGCTEYFVDSKDAIIQDCDADICTLPLDVGPAYCEAIVPRYFYNSNTAQCDTFIYRGCDGNANNFETLSDCQATCLSCGVQGRDCIALGAPAALCPDGRTCYLNCGGCVYTNDGNDNLVCSPEMVSQEVCPTPICGGFGANCAEYNDGCNDCTCFEDGSEACTEKACAPDTRATPLCTRCKPGYLFNPATNQCEGCLCTMQFDPVCCDGNTQYSNACAAGCQQATGCRSGPCAVNVPCCDPALKPDGSNGNPFCFEGFACCRDGTWSCSIGDGVTFSCGNIINNPEAFGEECAPSVGCGSNHCTSYNDGCNECTCFVDGMEACTKRACMELVVSTPKCTGCEFGYRLDENDECVPKRGCNNINHCDRINGYRCANDPICRGQRNSNPLCVDPLKVCVAMQIGYREGQCRLDTDCDTNNGFTCVGINTQGVGVCGKYQ